MDGSKGRVLGGDAAVVAAVLQIVFETGGAMSPVRSGFPRQLEAGNQVVLVRAGTEVRRENVGGSGDVERVLAIEIPGSGQAGRAVIVAQAQTQRNLLIESEAQICALERVGVIVVQPLAAGVELIAKDVVVEAAVRTGQGCITVFGAVIAGVGAEAEFGNGRAAGAGPHLNYARHRVGTVECALRAAQELQAAGFGERKSAEVNGSSGLSHADTIDNHFVVIGIAAANKEG